VNATTQTRFPLSWPIGRPRTDRWKRKKSNFEVKSFAVARDELLKELGRMKAREVILSTNIELRGDGLPYANRRQPEDVGVAVYFKDGKGRTMAFSCDCWDKIEDNLRAITKSIEALRGIARWGSGDMMTAAFTGFEALPASPNHQAWHVVLCVLGHASTDEVNNSYRRLSSLNHPDRGGDATKMAEINQAYQQFKKERGTN
jgi:hypothetical protein